MTVKQALPVVSAQWDHPHRLNVLVSGGIETVKLVDGSIDPCRGGCLERKLFKDDYPG